MIRWIRIDNIWREIRIEDNAIYVDGEAVSWSAHGMIRETEWNQRNN